MNASRTSSVEKEVTSEETRLDYEDGKQLDLSRSVCYGLTWTPSRDEKLSSSDVSLRSLSSSPQMLNTTTINDRSSKYSLSNKSYESNQTEDSPKADRERCFEILKKLSTRTPTAISSSNDLDSIDDWLSGEKFFETPPKNYNEEDDIYTIPTRDKNDSKDIERTRNKEDRCDDVAHNFFELSSHNLAHNSDKTLIHRIDDFEATKETSDYGNTMNKFVLNSSQSQVEGNTMKRNVCGPSNRSMINDITSSHWTALENIVALGRTNVHNHIYLSTGYLDRFFDIPLSKLLKLTRRNARVRCIRRRILRRPKRSRSHVVGVAHRIGSMIEMQNVNNNSNKGQKGRSLPKKNVCDVLAEIDTELSANLRSAERLREQLPSCIPIDTVFTSEIKGTLNGVAKRCKDWIRNSNDREKAVAKMDDRLIQIVLELLDVIKREKYALLQEEQYYTRLQSVSIQGRQDFQKIKRLKNDAEQILSNGSRVNRSDWKTLAKKLLTDTLTIINEICAMEDNKENIKKSTSRKTFDRNTTKTRFINKSDGQTNSNKKEKLFSSKKENPMYMESLSSVQPIGSVKKLKTSTKGLDGNRDRIKMKEITDQRDKMLKQNEERAEKQSLGKTMRSVHTVLTNFGNHINIGASSEYSKVIKDRRSFNSGRINTGANLEYPKTMKDRRTYNVGREKDNTITSSINTAIINDPAKKLIERRKRQNSNNTPQPVWKPGGAFNNTTVLYAEPSSRRTIPVLCDKENPDLMRSVPVKHANPSEPTVSERNILKENRKKVHFEDERVTRLCKYFMRVKMQKGSENNANVLSETRLSTYTHSEVPLSSSSGTKAVIKSSEVNLSRQSSASKPHRPGIVRSISNNKNYLNNVQRDTRALFEAKSETSSSKADVTDKLEHNNSPSKFSIKSNEKNIIENKQIPSQQNLKESIPSDVVKSSMILLDDKNKLQSPRPSKTTSNELVKNTSQTNLPSCDPQKSPVTTLNSNSAVNTDYDLPIESGPSYVSVIDASCDAEINSTPNSITMIPSSKCCQVSLSSSSSTTYLNDDQPYNKNQSTVSTPTIEKDFLESSTDDESNYQTALNFDLYKLKNKRELSLNSLKNFLHDLEISADLIQEIEEHYELKNLNDRRKSMRKSNETSPCNVSKDFTSTTKSPVAKTSIGPEPDSQLLKRYEVKSDGNRSTDSIGSLDYSINVSIEKSKESTQNRNKSKSCQTISNDKEYCDAYTDAEDMKSDCSEYVDAMVSCYEVGMKTSFKDVATEIFAEDKSILSAGRMVETQTNPCVSPSDNVAKLAIEEEEVKDNSNDRSMEAKCEQSYYENKDNMSPNDASKNYHEKSFERLLNSEDGITIDKSPLSPCLIHRLEDIKEQLQNVGAQLNKLQEPAKETNDAFSQIDTITSIGSESIELSTTSLTSGISKESFEEFNTDFMETMKNRISNDIINAFQKIEWYASNWNEAIRLYREYSNIKRFEEYEECSTSSCTSDEAVNVSKNDKYTECDIPVSRELVDEDSCRPCNNEKTEINSEMTSCLFEKPSEFLNETRVIDCSDESEETKSHTSSEFEYIYMKETTKSASQKSSCGSVFFETQDLTDEISSSINIRDKSSATMKHSEKVCSSTDIVEERDAYDSSEFVLSRETLLLLTYLTICAFVFCCLKFSMTCESLIL